MRPVPRTDWLSDISTRDMLRPPLYRRTSRGHFLPAAVGRIDGQLLTTQRIMDALPLLPVHGAIGGWAAAFMHGAWWIDGIDRHGLIKVPIHLGSDHGRTAPEVKFVHDELDDDEITTCHGLPVTTLTRTAFDTVRWADDLLDGVVAMDAMLRFTALSTADFSTELQRRAGWRGVRRAREALLLADPEVLSPWESRLRAVYVSEAALPVPWVNPWVFDGGWHLLGRPDLLDRDLAHAVEYDGAYHEADEQRARDRIRQFAFERAGAVVTRIDRDDFGSRSATVERIKADRLNAPTRQSCSLRIVPAGTLSEVSAHPVPDRARQLIEAVGMTQE